MSAVICRQSDRHRLAILAVDEVVLFDLAIPQQMFPMAWLYGARVRRAQSLLESSRMSVEQIAAACGFGSAAGLREAFRREVGSSPSAWRKTYSALATTDS